MTASIFFMSSPSARLPHFPECGQGDTRDNGEERRSHFQGESSSQKTSSAEVLPVHFVTRVSAKSARVITAKKVAGVTSDLFHSGFCVPSRISLRISCNCFFARDSSQAFRAKATDLSVSSSALGKARRR